MTRIVARAGLVMIAATTLSACLEPLPVQTVSAGYATHCGLAQMRVEGVVMFPVRVRDDAGVVAVGSDPGKLDSEWVTADGSDVPVSEMLAAVEPRVTGGYFVLLPEGTAEFHIAGTDFVVELSREIDDAAYRWETCET